MQMMVHTACSDHNTYSLTRNGRTLTCTFYSFINGVKPDGIDGFQFTIDSVPVTVIDAARFIQEKDK